MGEAENIVKVVVELLKRLLPEDRAQAFPLLKELAERRMVTSQDTVVISRKKPAAAGIEEAVQNCKPVNYYLIKGDKLGEGGMGIVYRAYDVELERDVALKILNKDDKEFFERFVRERKITAELDHPNFVRILTTGYFDTPHGQKPFYTMPLIKGDTLEKLITRRSLPGQDGERIRNEFTRVRLLQLAQQICLTIQSAHDKSIIHRDLKPSNVIVGPYGESYVMDLGLAKRLKEQAHSGHFEAKLEERLKQPEQDLTLESGIGTPYYMAPEQLLAPQTVDHRTDIFGIGGILYCILTGQRPQYVEKEIDRERIDLRRMQIIRELQKFGRATELVLMPTQQLAPEVRPLVDKYIEYDALLNESFHDKFCRIMRECSIIPPSKVVQEQRDKILQMPRDILRIPLPEPVQAELDAICMKAMAKNPDERYQSCRAMWQEIQQVLEGKPEMILEREGKDIARVMSRDNKEKGLEDFELAEIQVQETIDKLERMGRMALEEKLKMIDLLLGKARFYERGGQNELIVESFEKAKHLIEGPLNTAQRQYIRLIIMEGLSHFNRKDYHGAKQILLKSIDSCKSHPDKKLLLSAYNNYGLACLYDFGKRRDIADFTSGHRALTECFKLADQLKDALNAVHARALLAYLFIEKEMFSDAKAMLEEALPKADNDSLVAEAQTAFSFYHLKLKDYQNSISHGELAAHHAEKAGSEIHLNEARLAIGQAYHHAGNVQKRIENLKPVLLFMYPREPPYEQEVREFYQKHGLSLSELE